MDISIWELLSHGGGAMYVVVAFSVIALAVGIERAIALFQFTGRARALGDTVTRCLARGALQEGRSACERSKSPIADVFLVGYERLNRAKPEHVMTAVHRERMRVNQALRTRLWMLGTIGATAPFVGLFGTVAGIIGGLGSFQKGQQVGFSDVAGPVSQALIVTAAGILVAVESVILFNFFSQRANRVATEMKLLTDEFLELLLDAPEESEPKRTRKPEADADVKKDVEVEKKSAKEANGREAA
jgi:biopolymer transport protein ExbB/TolQ